MILLELQRKVKLANLQIDTLLLATHFDRLHAQVTVHYELRV